MQKLNHHIHQLTTIKRAPTKYGTAPHKPVLLLSLIDLMEALKLDTNQFPIESTLFETFKTNWQLLVTSQNVADITLPLYHLQTDGFWEVFALSGERMSKRQSSKKQLLKHGFVGRFDTGLFTLMANPAYRPVLKMAILDHYFPETKYNYQDVRPLPEYFAEAEAFVLEEPQAKYSTRETTISGFVRSTKFKQHLLRIYDNTCCISGLKVDPKPAPPIVEACHILQHAKFGDDTITNGLALCVNLHRAFDAGLIGVADDYTILIKKSFKETESPYGLVQWEGQRIMLPAEQRYWPDLEKLAWHRGERSV